MSEKTVYVVHFQSPYGECEWRRQNFASAEKAESMLQFYLSCRVPARLEEEPVIW